MKRHLLTTLALTLAIGAIAPTADAFEEPSTSLQPLSLEALIPEDTKSANTSFEDNNHSKNVHHFRRRRFRRSFGRRRFRRFRHH